MPESVPTSVNEAAEQLGKAIALEAWLNGYNAAVAEIVTWLRKNDAEVVYGGFSHDAGDEVQRTFGESS